MQRLEGILNDMEILICHAYTGCAFQLLFEQFERN